LEEELKELREGRQAGRVATLTSLECRVCTEEMAPPAHIFQWGTRHKVCSACRLKLQQCPVR
jgi:hypothetical protein